MVKKQRRGVIRRTIRNMVFKKRNVQKMFSNKIGKRVNPHIMRLSKKFKKISNNRVDLSSPFSTNKSIKTKKQKGGAIYSKRRDSWGRFRPEYRYEY